MSKISVLGIFVADISFSGNKIPSVGETILGDNYNIGPGGKGCNQAITIARLGGEVNFISKIGKDDYGLLAINTLNQNNIDTSSIIQSLDHQTGVAGIMIDNKTGKNAINVITGAPSTLTIKEINKNIDKIKNSKIFLTQLEIPKDVTLHSLKKAKENKVLTILNPAPASEISSEFFSYIDYFTPNETEASFYLDHKVQNESDAKKASDKFLEWGIKNIIITMGEKGAYFANKEEQFHAPIVNLNNPVVDTTGAGDAFNGGLAVALIEKQNIKDAIKFASATAGLSTTKIGTANSMPSRSEIDKLL